MKRCINDPDTFYLGNEPSPKGFGYCAHAEKKNKMMIGRDGKVWIVKEYNSTKRWVVSDFNKEYEKSLKKLIKLLGKTPIKYKIISNLDRAKYREEDEEEINPNRSSPITVEFELNEISKLIASFEFKRCAYESEFFKYVMYDSMDVGGIKKTKSVMYWYYLSKDFKLLKAFEKEKKAFCTKVINLISKDKKYINNLNEFPEIKKYMEKTYLK